MPLFASTVRSAQPAEKPYKLTDGGGLYLLVRPSGSKYWRWDYRFGGRRKTFAVGVYPDITLAAARDIHSGARQALARGVDPSAEKQAAKRAAAGADTFEAIAIEWFETKKLGWAESHSSRILLRMKNDVLPWLGKKPIDRITAPEVLEVLRRVEARGAIESAHRICQNIDNIYVYAIASGRATMNPAASLSKALKPVRSKRFPSIKNPAGIGALMRAIEDYDGSFITRCALQLAALTFQRPGELRGAEWAEISFEEAQWRIPERRMKMRRLHIVPLSRQVMDVLTELYPLTGNGKYLFPSTRSKERCMSNNTVNAALRRLGYPKEEMTGHGFRSMASTRLNEAGWHEEAIERQLAHVDATTRGIYNAAEYLPERTEIMQWWADYLDDLRHQV